MATEVGADWDPLAPEALRDPVGAHAELRVRCPVAHSDRWGGFWALMRHEDVLAAALDTETFISAKKTTIPDSTGTAFPDDGSVEEAGWPHLGPRTLPLRLVAA